MRSFLILFAAAAVLPAMAQERREEQREQAIQACREAVRQQAVDRFGARGVEFRDARVDPDGDMVVGRIDIPRQDYEDHLRFSCRMDFDRDEVQSVQLTPMGGEGSDRGYRERSAEGIDRAMDNCRNAVAGRLSDQGYAGVRFDSVRVDEQDQRIFGGAQARRGDDARAFNFSCSVELRDGDLRSVNVTRR